MALSELGESAKSGQIVIDTTLLLSLLLVLFTSFLLLETALDLFFDKELLAGSGGDKLDIAAFEVLLVSSKLLSFEIHLRFLRIEQLAFLEKLKALHFNIVADLINVVLGMLETLLDHLLNRAFLQTASTASACCSITLEDIVEASALG